MDLGRLQDINYVATRHGALAAIGIKQGGPKLPPALASHDGHQNSISVILDVPGLIDELTLLLKLGQGGGDTEEGGISVNGLIGTPVTSGLTLFAGLRPSI